MTWNRVFKVDKKEKNVYSPRSKSRKGKELSEEENQSRDAASSTEAISLASR